MNTPRLLLHLTAIFIVVVPLFSAPSQDPDDYLELGDAALGQGRLDQAIENYLKGIEIVNEEHSLETEVSLHTNLATAYSSIGESGDEDAQAFTEKAIQGYENALKSYSDNINDIVDKSIEKNCDMIAAQAAFFLGMEYQDARTPQDAVDAYQYAYQLDKQHWAALANMASVLHDELKKHDKALDAYNKAYSILTNTEVQPTDPPEQPKFILSELQYRIGLCITHDPNRKCALENDPDKAVDCKEMAAHAFSLALQFDPDNENAKHMLATTTADATMKRASNKYVKSLFDDYASNFEHSLVDELQYNGFERLRRGFDRAFDGGSPPIFGKVIDAGCGTGLVGEQFKNVSSTLIGVDLSEAILLEAEKARPNLYNELVAEDLIEVFTKKHAGSIDLIVAADSYIYFGDLDPLFDAMQTGVKEGGYLAFTLENVSEDTEASLEKSDKADSWRWQLTASGRFAHRKEYVIRTANEHDFQVVHYETLDNFRYESGAGVRGHVFVMQKMGDDTASDAAADEL